MTPREYVDVIVPFEDKDFRVRLHRDGTLEFLDPEIQIEYEQAFAAMGGEKSPALRLLAMWGHWPSRILGMVPIKKNAAIRLAVDYCRRVMPVYYKSFPSDDRPKKVLRDLMRRSRGEKISDESAEITAAAALKVMGNATHASYRRYAAECAGRSLHHAARDVAIYYGSISSIADTAAAAVAHDEAEDLPNTPRYDTQEFNDIIDRENAWQVRRFIDVVGAVQEKQRIPRFGETR